MKKITILGSTGSIGKSALEVASAHRDRFKVVGLAAGSNIDLLQQQIREFEPEIIAVSDPGAAQTLRERTGMDILEGEEGVCTVAAYAPSDFVLSAIVGFSGLLPTLSAIRAGKVVGLANKESVVVAGEIVKKEAKSCGATIIPVDSEHSAVFQCLEGRDLKSVSRVVLTASGGPFFGMKQEALAKVTPKDALNHPSWSMGNKITVDSATLMNKGFEVMEAHQLFGIAPEQIGVLIHRQSILHCIVDFTDGCSIAQMALPDMKAPIAYAMSYPERLSSVIAPLRLEALGSLTFDEPDLQSFPCLSYAYRALEEGGTLPAVLNAANEVAVHAFLEGSVGFCDIPAIIKKAMDRHETKKIQGLDAVLDADTWARQTALALVKQAQGK